MNRLATVLLCTFLLAGFASAASATPPAAPSVPAPIVTSTSPAQPLFLPGTCSAPVEATTFSPVVNYCGDCAVDSHCTPICGPGGVCSPAEYNPRCGVCICA
jgi:hypothetical protein